MAYYITFYCSVGEIVPSDALRQLVLKSGTLAEGPLYVTDPSSGDGWTSANLASTPGSGESWSVRLELHFAEELVGKMIGEIPADGAPQGIYKSDAVAIITLSGEDIDWTAVRVAWRLLEELWRGIPYDDVSGFDVSIESLG